MVLKDDKKKFKKDFKVIKSEENEEVIVIKEKKKFKKKFELVENGEKENGEREEVIDIKEKKKFKKDKIKVDKFEEMIDILEDSVVKEKKKLKKDKIFSVNGYSVIEEVDIIENVNGIIKNSEEIKNGVEVFEKIEVEILGDFLNFRLLDVIVEKFKSKCVVF